MVNRFLLITFLAYGPWLGAGTCAHAEAAPATPDSVAISLQALDDLFHDGKYDAGVAAAESLGALWSRVYGPDSLELARCLDRHVRALGAAGRGSEPAADELSRRALAITEARDPDGLYEAAAIMTRAAKLRLDGRAAESIPMCEKALAIRQRLLDPGDTAINDAEAVLAIALASAGRLADSRPYFAHVAAAMEAAHGLTTARVGAAYANLAHIDRLLGDLASSRAAGSKALACIEKVSGPDHPLTAFACMSQASNLLSLGDLRGAEPLFQRALAIYEANDMGQRPNVIGVLTGLGQVAQGLGDHEVALRYFERARAGYETAYGLENPEECDVLNNLAIAHESLGEVVQARQILEQSLRLVAGTLGADHPSALTTEAYLGMVERRAGDLDAAGTHLEHCLPGLIDAVGDDHYRVAEVRSDLASIRAARGDLRTAAALLDSALDGAAVVIDPQVEASLHANRSSIRLRQGRADAALTDALTTEDLAAQQFRVVVQTLGENVAQKFALSRVKGLDLAISALLEQGPDRAAVAKVWDRVIRSRGMVLDELVSRRRAVASADDDTTRELADAVHAARSQLADLYVRGMSDRLPTQFAQMLQDAKLRKREAETALAARSASYRTAARGRDEGLDAVRAALPTGATLVAYQRFGRVRGTQSVPWYCGFVLAATGERAIDLGPAATIDSLVTRWRAGLAAARVPVPAMAEQALATNLATGGRLRTAIWDPLTPCLGDASLVFVVPSGDLHLLPLAALPDTEGGFLVEHDPVIHYLSREKGLDLVSGPAGRGLVLVGDPDFDLAMDPSPADPAAEALRGGLPGCADFVTHRFTPLPGTRQECEAIAALASGPVTMLSGAAATEDAFKHSLPGHRFLHVATHGWFLAGDCQASTSDFPDDPLLLAGLALAGANRRAEAQPGQEDAIVTAEEISTLDLDGVDWAVLSACDTGLGETLPGEGVFGLQRAFEIAGARTVIMSLWPVEDVATREWMTELYRARLQDGFGSAVALREASRRILAQRRASGRSVHPFLWAAFVGTGDWR